jgi:hypothetical protein
LFLYDVTSAGYNRDGKRGKLQIVIGLLTDQEGEPLAVRVFAGNTNDPMTVADQIAVLRQQFGVGELVLVGDRGMIKSKGKQALHDDGLRYISALTDPQIRKLLSAGTLQMGLFTEQVAEVEDGELRYVLRNATRRWAPRRDASPKADEAARDQAMLLAGCYAIVTDVVKTGMAAQDVHDNYMRLQKVERDFRAMKTGLLEVRPVFVRKEGRTRGHVFCSMLALKITREMERCLKAAFGTTDTNAEAVTLPDALNALGRLCLLEYNIDGDHTATRLPVPSPSQTEILKALTVSLPSK